MPREWFDRHSAMQIEDEETRSLYLSLLADKKPYFMRYIYPDLMKQYNKYIKNTNKKALREFSQSMVALLAKPDEERTEQEKDFIRYYKSCMPVGMGSCVTNRVCKRIEDAFDGYIGRHIVDKGFDYRIMRSNAQYTRRQFDAILSLFDEFNSRVREYSIHAAKERVDDDEAMMQLYRMKSEFRTACDIECPNARALCNIMLDICYQRGSTKAFVWTICADEIIENLLERNNWAIQYPVEDESGDVDFAGKRFSFRTKKIGGIE